MKGEALNEAGETWDDDYSQDTASVGEPPEKLYWVKGPFGSSAHDVRVYPEDIEYVRVAATQPEDDK